MLRTGAGLFAVAVIAQLVPHVAVGQTASWRAPAAVSQTPRNSTRPQPSKKRTGATGSNAHQSNANLDWNGPETRSATAAPTAPKDGFNPTDSRHSLRIVARGTVKGRPQRGELETMVRPGNAGEIEWIEDRRVVPAQFGRGPDQPARLAQNENYLDDLFGDQPATAPKAAEPMEVPRPETAPDSDTIPTETFDAAEPFEATEPPRTEVPETPSTGTRDTRPEALPPEREPYGQTTPYQGLNGGRTVPDVPDGYDCNEHQRLCQDTLDQLRQRGIDQISLELEFSGTAGRDYPCTCQVDPTPYTPRNYMPLTMHWVASSVCHKPLYFEQAGVERYGHTVPLVQPLVSAGCFYGTLPILPYKMGMNPCWECMYPLGYYRPGSCAPYHVPPIPWSLRGAAAEGGVVTGLNFIIP